MKNKFPIGVFDSGYGGLTVLKEIKAALPDYDFIYLGDNNRAPYGPLPYNTVYAYTLACVQWLFNQGCNLVILACNTASAKALRTIQQNDLPNIDTTKRVLGVIRPTTEVINQYTYTNHIGIVATVGTVSSSSYIIEINKLHPLIKITQQACPDWVQLVEHGKILSNDEEMIVKKDLDTLLAKDPAIDCILLACTHYPLLMKTIKKFVPASIKIISQGQIVATSLAVYLQKHHTLNDTCSQNGALYFYTTGNVVEFDVHATNFFGGVVRALHIKI